MLQRRRSTSHRQQKLRRNNQLRETRTHNLDRIRIQVRSRSIPRHSYRHTPILLRRHREMRYSHPSPISTPKTLLIRNRPNRPGSTIHQVQQFQPDPMRPHNQMAVHIQNIGRQLGRVGGREHRTPNFPDCFRDRFRERYQLRIQNPCCQQSRSRPRQSHLLRHTQSSHK